MEALFNVFYRKCTFDEALKHVSQARPISGFEDLAWLFACNLANMGVAQLAFDEAAYLFRNKELGFDHAAMDKSLCKALSACGSRRLPCSFCPNIRAV